MKAIFSFSHLLIGLIFCSLFLGGVLSSQAQVTARKGALRDGGAVRLQKDIPVRLNPVIEGNGQPTYLYVIQLARFENMKGIPSTFPKGTFLWVNPDHRSEMLLLTGFYEDRDKAYADAQVWKKKVEFKGAFVRAKPFMIRYD